MNMSKLLRMNGSVPLSASLINCRVGIKLDSVPTKPARENLQMHCNCNPWQLDGGWSLLECVNVKEKVYCSFLQCNDNRLALTSTAVTCKLISVYADAIADPWQLDGGLSSLHCVNIHQTSTAVTCKEKLLWFTPMQCSLWQLDGVRANAVWQCSAV